MRRFYRPADRAGASLTDKAASGSATRGFRATPVELDAPDLGPWRIGNTGIDYVHRFESGQPGPNVLVNALTHGNEFCGMVAVCHLLESGVRPKIGTLTLSFANVAAYENAGLTPEIVPRAGHSPQVEAPDDVVGIISDFVK